MGFVSLGFVSLFVAQSAMFGGIAYLRRGNTTGVLPHVWTAPVARWVPLAGATLFDLLQGLVQAALILIVAFVVFGAAATEVSPLAGLTLLLALAAFWGFGTLLSGLGLVWRTFQVPYLVNAGIFLMAGAAYPIGTLPREVRWISYALPHTYVIDSLRSSMLGTSTLLPLGIELGIVAGFAAVSVVGGVAAFNRFDRIAARRGLIGLHT